MTTTPAMIVGGGPAGASCALALASAGHEVTLFERADAGARSGDKVCGEFLGTSAIAFLDELDFPWSQADAVPYRNLRLGACGRESEVALPFVARGVRRAFLDPWLLDRAARAGATVHRGSTVRAVNWEERERCFSLRTDGDLHEAGALFCATGKHALPGGPVRQARDGGTLVGLKLDFVALSASVRRRFDETLELFFFPRGYGGIARVTADRITVCLLIQRGAGRTLGWQGTPLLYRLAEEVPSLSLLLAGARPESRRTRAVAALPYGHLHETAAGPVPVYALGDQFAVLPSLSGTGISFALATGRLAAAQHVGGSPDAVAGYTRQARAAAASIMRWSLPLHQLLQRPTAARVGLAAARVFPPLVRWLATRTRLSTHEVLT